MTKYNRKLNRLTDFDYSNCGYYYVTICIKGKVSILGEMKNETMILNSFGEIAGRRWKEIPEHYENVGIDEYIIMPNHIHGIIIIKERIHDMAVETEQCSVSTKENNKSVRRNYGLLSKIVKSFKNAVTNDVKEMSSNSDFKWQRSFYDHIVRNDEALDEIRQYISENPLKWHLDRFNLERGRIQNRI